MPRAGPDAAAGVIRWHPADCEGLARPAAAMDLLQRAVEANPANAMVHARLGALHLDGFDFAAAVVAFEAAIVLDPEMADARVHLARCLNELGRPGDVLDLLGETDTPELERGLAFAKLGRTTEAEAEYRALLAADPFHRHACRHLCRLLRKAGRTAEMLETCEHLHARGADHAQLLFDWGIALALTGEHDKARAILFNPARVTELVLPVPDGFASIEAFNAALSAEILANPYQLGDFPADEANCGSRRVHALLAGRRPELVRLLLASLQSLVGAHDPAPRGAFDPWCAARPSAAHLRAWGLIQRRTEYEAMHIHRGGWLSGVYYLRVPRGVSAEGAGGGCIEFGPPPALARALPDLIPSWRHAPREGTLLLAPSHFSHRTIPTGLDEYRISFAFDVVPETVSAATCCAQSTRVCGCARKG